MLSKKMKSKVISVLLSAVMTVSSAAAVTGAVTALTEHTTVAYAAVSPSNDSYLSTTAITKGQSVTVYGVMNGTNSKVTYAYYYKKASAEKWTTAKGYSTAASVKITPAAAVDYLVRVDIKDSTGKILKKQMQLKVSPALQNQSSISGSVLQKGSSVTLKASAKGGSGTYTYAYYWKKKSAASWVTISNYSSSKTASFKPASVTDYELMIKVRDSHGAIEKKTFSLQVVPKLVNESKISASSIAVNTSVTLTGAASGGLAPYTYSFSYQSDVRPEWTVMHSYSSTQKLTCTMQAAGKYTILIKVKDSSGAVSSKTFSLTVSDSALDKKADAVIGQIITSDMGEYDKVKAIHDWMLNNVRYDTASSKAATSYTAEGLFDTHVAVCDGYSRAFLLLCQRAGLSAVRVTGLAANSSGNTEKHAWNQVKVDGKWYNIDVTWDDPVVPDGYGDNRSYEYFLIPDSLMDLNHTAQSGKNTCSTPQPVDLLLPVLLKEEQRSIPTTTLYQNENEMKTAISNLNVKFSNTFVMLCKTTLSQQEIFDLVGDNLPQGNYRVSYGVKDWKLRDHLKVTIQIRVA